MTDDLEWDTFVVVERIDIYDEAEAREIERLEQNEKQRIAMQLQSSVQQAIA
jgi:hypothetical protein